MCCLGGGGGAEVMGYSVLVVNLCMCVCVYVTASVAYICGVQV